MKWTVVLLCSQWIFALQLVKEKNWPHDYCVWVSLFPPLVLCVFSSWCCAAKLLQICQEAGQRVVAKTMLDFDVVWFDLLILVNQAFPKLSPSHFYFKKKIQGPLKNIEALIRMAIQYRALHPKKAFDSFKEAMDFFMCIYTFFFMFTHFCHMIYNSWALQTFLFNDFWFRLAKLANLVDNKVASNTWHYKTIESWVEVFFSFRLFGHLPV